MPKIDGIQPHRKRIAPRVTDNVTVRGSVHRGTQPKTFVIEEYITEEKTVSHAPFTPYKRYHHSNLPRYIGIGFVACLGICALLSYFSHATVILTARTLDRTLNTTFTLSENRELNPDVLSSVVTFTDAFSQTETLTTTRQADVSARGQVAIFNSSSKAVTLPANSVLASAQKIQYLTDTSVKIPARSTGADGALGKAVVMVHASKTGPGGNSDLSDFTVSGKSSLVGRGLTPMSGGLTGNVYVVSPDMTTTLDAGLSHGLSQELHAKALRELPFGYTVLDQFTVEQDDPLILPSFSATNMLKIQKTGSLKVTIVKTKDLADVVVRLAAPDFIARNTIVAPDLRTLTLSPTTGGDFETVAVSGSVHVIFVPDVAQIKKALLGIKRTSFETTMSRFESVGQSHMSIWPLWMPSFPTKESRIRVLVQ